MKEILMSIIISYGPVILFIFGSSIVLAIISISIFLTPWIISLLKRIADTFESEKIRTRLHDSIDKLDVVINDLLSAESSLYKEEMIKIIADGKIEKEEIKELVTKMANLAYTRLAPEHETLKKFFVGEFVQDFITTRIQGKIIEWAKSKLPEISTPSTRKQSNPR